MRLRGRRMVFQKVEMGQKTASVTNVNEENGEEAAKTDLWVIAKTP